MGREIKFRGRALDGGKWLFGDLTYYAGGAQIWVDTDNGKWNYAITTETVGQFTGLHDKNGKEIYEGDICDDARDFRFVVVWDEENARFLGRGIGACKEYIRYVGQEPAVAFIGNIYENPELLGVSE